MTIVIDTREQTPWIFPEGVATRRATIQQGDYALDGDATFALERKNAADFRGTVAGKAENWDRFKKELSRMDEVGFPAKIIIVEGDMGSYLFEDTPFGIEEPAVDCDPVLLMHRLAELTLKKKAAVIFARDAGTAAAMAYHIFCVRLGQLKGKAK